MASIHGGPLDGAKESFYAPPGLSEFWTTAGGVVRYEEPPSHHKVTYYHYVRLGGVNTYGEFYLYNYVREGIYYDTETES
jgi:hypothetical protein